MMPTGEVVTIATDYLLTAILYGATLAAVPPRARRAVLAAPRAL
jgi:hypothetical protein